MREFPEEVTDAAMKAVMRLCESGYFESEFERPCEACSLFLDVFSESLLGKFLNGEELEWTDEEYEKVFGLASVEHAVNELDSEGLLYRFDELVVLREKQQN